MSQTFSGVLHLLSSSAPATAAPLTMVIWVNSAGGQGRRYMELSAGATETTGVFGVLTDITAASNKISAYRLSASTSNQALTGAAMTVSTWQHLGVVFASTASAAAYLGGSNKGTSGAVVTPTTPTQLLISGRPSDFAFGIGGQAAHAALWTRALSDTEMAYLGAGGNPRALKGIVCYWKISTSGGVAETPVIDQIGAFDLTPSATMGAGTTDPDFESYFLGTIGTQSYTAGAAITSINVGVSGTSPLFDNVSAAGTATLKQLGSATAVGTTASALTAVREFALSTLTGITVGGYIKVTSGGTPTRVLGTNATTTSVLVAADQTFASGAQVYYLAVNSLAVAGLSITSNVFAGTPTANSSYTNCLFRHTNNNNSALFADSNLFSMSVTGGGGGGGGLMMPAGVFCGGFIGG